MIDISFLSEPTPLTLRSGMEYLDWQNKDFFNTLTQFFGQCDLNNTGPFHLTLTDAITLSGIIKTRTGMTVVIDTSRDHFSMQCGSISPHHLLNRKGIEKIVNADDSVVGQTLRWLNTQSLTGRCNLKTAQVEGDFQDVVFTMGFGQDDAQKFATGRKTEGYAKIAAAVLHELGHAFFSLHYISQTVIDNLLLSQVVKYYTQQTDNNQRVRIARELKAEADIALPETVIQTATDPGIIAIGFEEGRRQRETRRTLSLGVERITGETLADIYAVRMGASLALLHTLGAGRSASMGAAISLALVSMIIALSFSLDEGPRPAGNVIAAASLLVGVIVTALRSLTTLFNPWRLLAEKEYDTPYRRMKAVLRENIAYINSLPSSAEKSRLITEARQMDALIEKQKPFFESTQYQRALGRLFQGRDIKKKDFEYFTAELAAPTLSLYTRLP